MEENKKKKITLSSEDLNNIIVECVTRVLMESDDQIMEGFWDMIKGAAKKVGSDVQQAGANAGTKVGQMANNALNKTKEFGNKIQQGVQQGVNNVKNYANDVKQAGINASNNADINHAIELIQSMQQRQLVNPRAAQMVISSMKKYLR